MRMRAGRRSAIVGGLILGLFAAGLANVPVRAAAGGLDPAVPPPVPEPIASVVLECGANQVDFNTALDEQISALFREVFGDPKRPTAQRVVQERRPFYLDLDDLEIVNGIGPGGVKTLRNSGHVCFGLPSMPPPVDRAAVCGLGDRRVDINDPSSEQRLARIFNRNAATEIVGQIPHNGTAGVVAEHVPGAGRGRDRAAAQLCYTPPTIHDPAQATSWTFARGGQGVRAASTSGEAVLRVPASAAGQDVWVRIEDMVDTGAVRELAIWAAEFDEAGLSPEEWSTPAWDTSLLTMTGSEVQPQAPVHLTMALDAELAAMDDAEPVLLHFNGDSTWEAYRSRVFVTASDIAVWLTTLSATSLQFQFAFVAPIIVRLDDGSSQTNQQSTLERLYGDEPANPPNDTDPACDTLNPRRFDPNLGTLTVLRSSTDFDISYCSYFDGTYGTYRVRNNRSIPVAVSMTGGSSYVRAFQGSDNALNRVLIEEYSQAFDSWTQGTVFLAPNSVAGAQLRRHTGDTGERVDVATQAGATAQFLLSKAILEAAGLDNSAESYVSATPPPVWIRE